MIYQIFIEAKQLQWLQVLLQTEIASTYCNILNIEIRSDFFEKISIAFAQMYLLDRRINSTENGERDNALSAVYTHEASLTIDICRFFQIQNVPVARVAAYPSSNPKNALHGGETCMSGYLYRYCITSYIPEDAITDAAAGPRTDEEDDTRHEKRRDPKSLRIIIIIITERQYNVYPTPPRSQSAKNQRVTAFISHRGAPARPEGGGPP